MRSRRASHGGVRPLNCGVIRLEVVLAVPRVSGSADANEIVVKGQWMSQRTSQIIVLTAALLLVVTTRWAIAQNSSPAPSAPGWPPGPVYPAAFNRPVQDGEARKLQFLGVWQGANGATEFAPGTIRSDGTLLGEYSVVAHEEFVVVLEVTSPLYSAKYWRLEAIDYTRCLVARDGLACARPYEPGTRLDLTMYEDIDDALSRSRAYSGRVHYFSFRKSP